ncbi:sulfatase family protein [Lignipirellula cremea]|uniref:Choline-sulfatase n=1 Tax=Lignipirellula cremea TaxID=2528010 RepID=A0A518DPJ8_9BACT|nr:sulfatase [Lignipirellula cremea]QDU93765.1 Choline-sulfatase [Lignipirellula cremea]
MKTPFSLFPPATAWRLLAGCLSPIFAVCFALGSILLFAQRGSGAEPLNIVWITCEDMSPRLGCYGDSTVPTPNIDALAGESVLYRHAFGVYGVCAPNRHCLITGMYPTSTGAMAMRTQSRTSALHLITDPELLAIPTYEATPPAGVRCFPEYLRQAGYYCTNNVKTDYQFKNPIAAWDDSSDQAHWKNRPTPDTPFFAVFNSILTHESKVFQQTSPIVVDPAKVELPPYYPDTPIVRRDLARQYDNIAALDVWVGKLMQELREEGLLENTLVFFFSDHGDGLPRMKRWVYDSGIQVPLLVRYPDGAQAGTETDRLVSFVDFAPTVLSVAGLDPPAYMQGSVFLGAKQAEPRSYIYAARDRMDPAPETIRAVRDQRFKYVRNYRPDLPYLGFIPYRDQQQIMQEIHRLNKAGKLGPDSWQFSSRKKPLEELYDTQTDPHEIHNLAADPAHFDKLGELREAHRRWTRETRDLGHMPESELIKRLWPPDGKQPQTAPVTIEMEPRGEKIQATLRCETEGATIAWRREAAEAWQVYQQPLLLPAGTELQVKAHRLGWKPGRETIRTVK